MNKIKRFKLIACEILFREVCLCASKCKNIIDIDFLPKGLHDMGQSKMSKRLQQELDRVETDKYDAILLCYGLCNNGVKGLQSKLPIVIPKAHDCITLLLGSKEKYNEYFRSNPGTYFKSTGWTERDKGPENNELSIPSQLGMNKTYQEYVELYGEDNALYLMEILGNQMKNYSKIVYIDTQTGEFDSYKKSAKQLADNNNWQYEEVTGNTRLIFKLLNGDWNDEEFLTVPPDSIIEPTNTEEIIGYI